MTIMTQMNLCGCNDERVLNYIRMGLKDCCSIMDYDSSRVCLASLFYLLKKGALCYEVDAVNSKSSFFHINADDVYSAHSHEEDCPINNFVTIDLCNCLSVDDPLYDIVSEKLSSFENLALSGHDVSLFMEVVRGTIQHSLCDVLDSYDAVNPKDISNFSVPKELPLLASRIINVEGKTVFNPFSGDMSFAKFLDGYKKFVGVECNKDLHDYSLLYLALKGILTSNVESICSSLLEWTNDVYDCIVSMPPFNMKMQMLDGKKVNSSVLSLDKFDSTTTCNGKLVTFVNLGVLMDSSTRRLRENLVKNNYLDGVILLPNNLLQNTSIALAAIVLRKDRGDGDMVRMVDASRLASFGGRKAVLDVDAVIDAYYNDGANSVAISSRELVDGLCSFDPNLYVSNHSYSFRDGDDILYVSDILAKVKAKSKIVDVNVLPIVNVVDLPSDWSNYDVDLSSLGKVDNAKSFRVLTCPSLLISVAGQNFKMGWCEASTEAPVCVANFIDAYTIIRDDIHIGYLVRELSQKIEMAVVGNVVSRLNNRFNLIRIGFPSFEQPNSYGRQKTIYDEAKLQYLLAKAKENGLQEVIDKMKTDYINEVRSRKHDMMPHLRQLSSARKNIELYFEHRDSFSEKEFVDGVKEEVANQKRAIDSLTKILDVFSRESKFGVPEVVNVDKFLLDNYLNGHNYTCDYDCDYRAFAEYGFDIPKSLYNPDLSFDEILGSKDSCQESDFAESLNVLMAKDDLQRLCDNIFHNAVKHGFTNPKRSDYRFWINLTVDVERDMYRIDFSNNGTPLPKGMDKNHYGIRGEKAGSTAGTGEGGYAVKSIVEHYGGDFDVFSEESGATTWTTVRVYLPIYREEHE